MKQLIQRVPILPWGMVNAYLLVKEKAAIAVDAGLPDSEKYFQKALYKHGLALSDLKLIVVTHGHIDHAGGALKLHQLSGAPIVAHQEEVTFLNGEKPMEFCPTGWFGKLFLKTGAPREKWPYFEPQIVLQKSEQLSLQEFGFEGLVTATPGHTPGSISVLAGDQALVGDMLASGILLGGITCKKRTQQPPFEERPQQVAVELDKLVAAGYQCFHLGHGFAVDSLRVKKHAQRLRALGGSTI